MNILKNNFIYEWRCYCPVCNKILLVEEKGDRTQSKCPFCFHTLALQEFIGEKQKES